MHSSPIKSSHSVTILFEIDLPNDYIYNTSFLCSNLLLIGTASGSICAISLIQSRPIAKILKTDNNNPIISIGGFINKNTVIVFHNNDKISYVTIDV